MGGARAPYHSSGRHRRVPHLSGACSVRSHPVKAPMRRWISTSTGMNPTGLRRMSSSDMISRLKDDEWAERGLPITPAVDTGGSRTSVRGRFIAQARAGKGAASAKWGVHIYAKYANT